MYKCEHIMELFCVLLLKNNENYNRYILKKKTMKFIKNHSLSSGDK